MAGGPKTARPKSAFLTEGARTPNSRFGEVSEGQEALGTAGLETGATIFGDL